MIAGKQGWDQGRNCEPLPKTTTTKQRELTWDNISFKTLESTLESLSDPPSSTRPHCLTLPQELYQLGSKYSNTWVYGAHSHLNHNTPLLFFHCLSKRLARCMISDRNQCDDADFSAPLHNMTENQSSLSMNFLCPSQLQVFPGMQWYQALLHFRVQAGPLYSRQGCGSKLYSSVGRTHKLEFLEAQCLPSIGQACSVS